MKAAAVPDLLLLVDFINPMRFPGARALAPAALEAAQATAALKRVLRTRGVPAIYANDNYGRWRSDFRQLHARCSALPGAPGQIARLLRPRHDDLAVLKPRHSAFYGTPLELLLRERRVRRLVIVGLAADICVLQTAMEAHMRGFEVWIPRDCTAAESLAARDAALDSLAQALGVDIRPSRA